jgi:hypothetical protein
MKVALVALVIALAGCSTAARQTGEGSALPREAVSPDLAQQPAPLDRELLPDPQHDRSRYWSVRDFAQPRGLVQ